VSACYVSKLNPYRRDVGVALGTGALALAALFAAWFTLTAADDLVRRVVSFAAFMLVGGLGYLKMRGATR
jgi:hypothetical protein